ncbi:unnamed protein product [Lathyrus sativus]|nr:unnamed protein product [Lathyrus sativus]
MSIPLNDISCLLYLSIRGRFLHYGRMTKDEAVDMMVEHLGADPVKVLREVDMTKGAHVRFSFLKERFDEALVVAAQVNGDAQEVEIHMSHALRCYFLFLVSTMLFMDTGATYTDITYLDTSWISHKSMSTTGGRLAWPICIRS